MRIQLPKSLRGLLAGLLALVTFGSSAVAITAGGSGSATSDVAQSTTAQTVVQADDVQFANGRDGDDADGRDGDGGRRR